VTEVVPGVALPNPETVVKDTASDVVHFVTVLAEWLVPVIALVIGLFIGPLIFNGMSIAAALYTLGVTSTNTTSGGTTAILIGSLAGSGIIGIAGGSLWKYQEGKSGWSAWISRAFAGFTIGWALGILIQGLNIYFVTGAGFPNPLPWIDAGIWNLQKQLKAGAVGSATGTTTTTFSATGGQGATGLS
jgi:hypothetical protein